MTTLNLNGGYVAEDEEIQFLHQNSPCVHTRYLTLWRGSRHSREPITCQFCKKTLNKLSIEQRQVHYDRHFLNESHGLQYHSILAMNHNSQYLSIIQFHHKTTEHEPCIKSSFYHEREVEYQCFCWGTGYFLVSRSHRLTAIEFYSWWVPIVFQIFHSEYLHERPDSSSERSSC